jgi:hypothetical protein
LIEQAALERPFEEEEIFATISSMGNLKSTTRQFQCCIFEKKVGTPSKRTLKCSKSIENGIVNKTTNETYICSIPKKTKARMVGDFRPLV